MASMRPGTWLPWNSAPATLLRSLPNLLLQSVHPTLPISPRAWSMRWGQLARAAGILPGERLLLALSGGADSVLLLHLLAGAEPRPALLACHIDHGLRGAESEHDARFVETLCRSLGVPFRKREVQLDPAAPSLEARAREARYGALIEEAEASGHGTILTGHHSDDALETLLMRWIRGTGLPGLRGPRRSLVPGSALRPTPEGRIGAQASANSTHRPAVRIVRPLFALRREEVRRLLSDRGLRWREDSSNLDPRFTRNRVRHGFLPFLERTLGTEGIENLRAFGGAVESLEERLAGVTAHLAWTPAPHALASRSAEAAALGGVLPRAELMRLASPLRRRALWRLLTEGTGASPGKALLEALLRDLASGRCTRHALPARWSLVLRSAELQLLPPPRLVAAPQLPADGQATLPFPLGAGGERSARHLADLGFASPITLGVPGIVTLADGRRISAERLVHDAPILAPTPPFEVDLDARDLPEQLTVRRPRSGDRFHPLGGPGSKPLRRFLADRGVPREERSSIPLLVAGTEVLWIAGVEIGERHRLRRDTRSRLRLTLHLAPPGGPQAR